MNRIASQCPLVAVLLGSALLSTACAVQSERRTGDYGPSYYTSDAGIAERVTQAVRNQPGVNTKNIKVETFQGMVQLSGRVDSHIQMVKTVAAVNHVDGVKTVRSYLIEGIPRPNVGTAIPVAHAPSATPALVLASNNGARAANAQTLK